MDSEEFRRQMLSIQAELANIGPHHSGAVERAQQLADEVGRLAEEQRERATNMAAKAYLERMGPAGMEPPKGLAEAIERIESGVHPHS